mmetsp:Transcript_26786/g.22940  ORF Transcript_26786/g.22940 Transcript_26786/m.22940 type:complete len:120 (+) Transcript_26786:1-360(+)
MKTPLPVSIRINPSAPLWKDVAQRCEDLSKEPSVVDDSSDEDDIVKKGMKSRALDWYFDGYSEATPRRCWQWDSLGRKDVKKKAELKELKQWFVSQELRGCVARQEAVSMIPALKSSCD